MCSARVLGALVRDFERGSRIRVFVIFRFVLFLVVFFERGRK